VKVNGKRVTIPSYTCRKGDIVTLGDKARAMIVVRQNIDTLDRQMPAWIDGGDGGQQITVRETPIRAQIDVAVREQLIVELYSK
jgi:small subunit ribosomal protein S4